jgi:hypothetical protein
MAAGRSACQYRQSGPVGSIVRRAAAGPPLPSGAIGFSFQTDTDFGGVGAGSGRTRPVAAVKIFLIGSAKTFNCRFLSPGTRCIIMPHLQG